MEKKRTIKTELLAPAGCWESVAGAVAAGADAVYVGGTRFGARAYAQNLDGEKLREAIEYAHVRGKKVYLTVNTLLKEEELEQELYPWLTPLYETGLDAAIVQDVGVMRFLHRNFPDLSLHASTQMTVMGGMTGEFLKNHGVVRIVTPRELSLREIRAMKDRCGLEIECFVHGALCWSYSGQCLFSSIAGGRSANRGRCAQPCRMEYQLYRGKSPAGRGISQSEIDKAADAKSLNRPENGYLLSLKDLNALWMLPDLIEGGVDSLKIEGRMKKPEYTAGVVAIYRKYLDLYEEKGREGYKVDPEDQKILWDLFNRKGFTSGYFKAQNGKDMITFTKPDFRGGQEVLVQEINRRYLQSDSQVPIWAAVSVQSETPMQMTVQSGAFKRTVCGPVPAAASTRPLTEEALARQLKKTGGTPFAIEHLHVQLEDGLYVPIVQLNEMRRAALSELKEAICQSSRRIALPEKAVLPEREEPSGPNNLLYRPLLYAQVETRDQMEAALGARDVSGIYLDCTAVSPQEYAHWRGRAGEAQKQCFLVLPYIFRERGVRFLERHLDAIRSARFDGYLIRSLEELFFLREHRLEGPIAADHNLYCWNREAIAFLREAGCARTTVPIELTGREWQERGIKGEEVIVYGRLPMMICAQCLKQSFAGCDQTPDWLVLKDRLGNRMPVKNNCSFCYNTIYNSKPLALLEEAGQLLGQEPGAARFVFTTETKDETAKRLAVLTEAFQTPSAKPRSEQLGAFTRGHYRRKTM